MCPRPLRPKAGPTTCGPGTTEQCALDCLRHHIRDDILSRWDQDIEQDIASHALCIVSDEHIREPLAQRPLTSSDLSYYYLLDNFVVLGSPTFCRMSIGRELLVVHTSS